MKENKYKYESPDERTERFMRLVEAEERRSYFAKQFEETGKKLYAKMAESETDTISEIRQAIIEALVFSK